MQRPVLIVLMLALAVCPAIPEQPKPVSDLVQILERTKMAVLTVRVEKPGSWGPRIHHGAAVILGEGNRAVTAHHLVATATRITVKLPDGPESEARVLRSDAESDLALLQLPAGTYKPLALAIDTPPPGSHVLALGTCYGYEGTLSQGLVSHRARTIETVHGTVLHGLIQHSAALHPGSSGGPLLNMAGEVIGINVALREGGHGIGFAVRAATIQEWLKKQP